MSDLVEEFASSVLDVCECAVSSVASFTFWIVLVSSLALKQWYIRPQLEHYYKRTYAARSKIRKRRLRDTLNDPLLSAKIEEKLLRRPNIQGDRQKMLEAMEELRQKACDQNDGLAGGDESDNSKGDTTKGQERKEAAEAILWSTVVLSILVVCAMAIFPQTEYVVTRSRSSTVTYSTVSRLIPSSIDVAEKGQGRSEILKSSSTTILKDHVQEAGRRKLYLNEWSTYYEDSVDNCGGFGFVVSCYMFCLIHLVHSYVMLRGVTRKKRSSIAGRATESAADTDESKQKNLDDLEQPLLTSADE